MKSIITVQHTQSMHHLNGMVGSWTDWPLSDKGKEQAETMGERLKKETEGKEFLLYSSDLLRAKETAEIIGKHLGIKPIFKEVLRERNLGKAVGKSVAWLRENQQCQEKTVDDRLFSDAESRRDVWNRLKDFYESILADENEYILIVSHGDTLSIFNALFLHLSAEQLSDVDLFGMAGGVSFFQVNPDGKHILRKLSDLSYIR
ncbi:histidine phosphatase family protein [Proteiniclasticum sp. SCR006]|uniref:Histidine phosphatase family protein n=1 Tax=Proteiniclasticum aestuarii TaxID=2817862 RepID=A0A939KI06_9CLOT|nr:histidine phosphatase family protein [Proteiniclasticum aestuarii]MBO1266114.1 histidine phosphatase family protein [Proteiniclasticum aestuarii]